MTDFVLDPDTLADILPGIKDPEVWSDALNKMFPLFNVNNVERAAMFIAQTGHESGNFTKLSENLNYRAARLRVVFPKYFKNHNPDDYAGDPEALANLVYGNRMGNGDEQSGDGYKFRGRGIIQLTGKDNYGRCSQAVYGDLRLLDDPDLLTEPEGAVASALWYWNSRSLNQWSDRGDVREVTRRINGGEIGLAERQRLYKEAVNALSA